MRGSSKLPRDLNRRAAEIVRLSTEENQPEPERSPISQYLSEIGRKGGIKGGHARAKKLSGRKRSDIARNAAKARWAKQREGDLIGLN